MPVQEVLIILSYSAVAAFGFYGAQLSRKRKANKLTWLLLGIANIFVFCDINYTLHFFGAPQWIIYLEHYLVAIGGILAAVSINPWFVKSFLDERKELEDSRRMTDISKQLSSFCWVVIEWESDSVQSIVDVSFGMKQWVTRKGFAAPDSLAPGENWLSIFPHEPEWLDRNKETAVGGKTWRNMETTHVFEDGTIASWNWNMYLFSPATEAEHPKILIEWYDSTPWFTLVTDLRNELAKEHKEKEKLEKLNAVLIEENKTEVLARLDRIGQEVQSLSAEDL